MLRRPSAPWRGLAALGLVLAAAAVAAAKPTPSWNGRVTHVSDGDTLWVQPADGATAPVAIRIVDIDAPEICQPWGPQARDALQERAGGRDVIVRPVGRDGYGRTLARVTLDDLNLGPWLVQEGHAWSQRTRWDQGPLVKQETQARALRRGLHAQPEPVSPKEFRRRHGPCERAAASPRQ